MNDPIAAGTFSADAFAGDTAVVVPGTVVLELVLEAARSLGAAGVGDLRLTRPIVLPDVGELRWQILAGPLSVDGRRAVDFRVHRVSHASGELIEDATADGRYGFVDTADWPVRTLADAVRRDGLVPVRWRGVEIRPGAVRVHTVWDGDRGRVWLVDRHGDPAGYVDEVVVAPPDVEAVRAAPVEHVYRVSYREVAPTLRGTPGDRVVVDLTGVPDPVETALAHARSGARELVFLIDDSLACAPVRGLVRSLRAERPEWTVRLVEARADAAPAAVTAALDAVAPELVVAGSAFLAPELVPAALTGGRPVLDPDGTVLITGGTGDLGRLIATHLVAAHGIRHLLLVSRRGPDTPGVADQVADLAAAGARSVRVMAADVADRSQVAAALAAVSPRHPLTAVLHLAGVVDARLVEGQDNARFRRVLAPKVSGAWHLHELTRDAPLAAFVMFSSVASVLGSAGQSNYAAANAYLDALAAHRHAMGLVATSVSWGPWDGRGLSADLGAAEIARLRRQGVVPLTERQGRRIFDAAVAQDAPHLVAAVLTPPATVAPADLASLPAEDRWPATVALVRREVAVVLGAPVGPRQVLGDAGVDSLMALELRDRLTAATSVSLPATLVADHPTPTAIARLLVARLAPATPRAPAVGIAGTALGGPLPQTVWAALENAGVVPKSLRGRRVGVFLGVPEGDVAGRVAALFRLRGPAVTVCGSPLVAVHLARVALLREECELALAGGDGVVVLSPTTDSSRAALTDSALEGVGGATMADLIAAVTDRRWAELSGAGARVTVEPSRRPTAEAVGAGGADGGEAPPKHSAMTGVDGAAQRPEPRWAAEVESRAGRLGSLSGGGPGHAVGVEGGVVGESRGLRVESGAGGRGVESGGGLGLGGSVAAEVGCAVGRPGVVPGGQGSGHVVAVEMGGVVEGSGLRVEFGAGGHVVESGGGLASGHGVVVEGAGLRVESGASGCEVEPGGGQGPGHGVVVEMGGVVEESRGLRAESGASGREVEPGGGLEPEHAVATEVGGVAGKWSISERASSLVVRGERACSPGNGPVPGCSDAAEPECTVGRPGVMPGGALGPGHVVAVEMGGVGEESRALRMEPGAGGGVPDGGQGHAVAAEVGGVAGKWSVSGRASSVSVRGERECSSGGGLVPDELAVAGSVGRGSRAVREAESSTAARRLGEGLALGLMAVAERAAGERSGARQVLEVGPGQSARGVEAGWMGQRQAGRVVPVAVSGRDVEGLRRQAGRWAEWLEAHPDVSLAGVAWTAALCRTHFRVRAVVVAGELADAVEGLWAVARGDAHPRVVHGVARPGAGVVFASSGHSGPWVVPELLRESPFFARAVARYDALLRPLLGWSVADVLAGDGELDLEHPEVVRVAGLVGRVATAAALRGVGVVPTGGHGVVVPLAPVAGGVAGLMRVLAGVHVRGGPVLWERALPAGDLVDLPPYVFAPRVGATFPR